MGPLDSAPDAAGGTPGELGGPTAYGGGGEGDDLGEHVMEVLRQILAAVLAPPGLIPGLGELG